MAGQVESAGKDVTEFRSGDDVFALLSHGGFAEYVTVREGLLARKPENLPYEQAAAVPMAAVTALLGLRGAGKVQPGQKVLVNGASGNGRHVRCADRPGTGAEVAGVCSSRHADLVRLIGADEVIDYQTEDFTRREQRYDLVLDIAGSRSVPACRRAPTPRGTFVIVGGPAGRWPQPAGHAYAALASAPLVSQRIAIAGNAVGLQGEKAAPRDAGRAHRGQQDRSGYRPSLPVRGDPGGHQVSGRRPRPGKGGHRAVKQRSGTAGRAARAHRDLRRPGGRGHLDQRL